MVKPTKRKASTRFAPDQNWKKLKSIVSKPRRKGKGSKMGRSTIDARSLINPTTIPRLKPRKAKKSTVTNIVALDCEMVGIGKDNVSALARVCVLNESGNIIFDEFARPVEKITNYRTQFSGIRPGDLFKDGVRSAVDVSKDVRQLIGDKIIIGHSLEHDLEVLDLKHPIHMRRDTAYYSRFRKMYRVKPKLKTLAAVELNWSIQNGEHDPYIDARAALEIYKKYKVSWEASMKRKR